MCQNLIPSFLRGVGLTLPLLMTVACTDGFEKIQVGGRVESYPAKLIQASYCRAEGSDFVAITYQCRHEGWGPALRSVFSRDGIVDQLLLLRVPRTLRPRTFSAPHAVAGYFFFVSDFGPSGGYPASEGFLAVIPRNGELELSLEIASAPGGPRPRSGLLASNRYREALSLQKVRVQNRAQAVFEALSSGVTVIQPDLKAWKEAVEGVRRGEQPQ
jgi:hypothetical protein